MADNRELRPRLFHRLVDDPVRSNPVFAERVRRRGARIEGD
jgi:hypothetical protein